jgi:glycyl-tRNA synthetase (class II)
MVDQDREDRGDSVEETESAENNNHKEIIKSLVLSFAKHHEPIYRRLSDLLKKDGFPETFTVFEDRLMSTLFEMQSVYQSASSIGMVFAKIDNTGKKMCPFFTPK